MLGGGVIDLDALPGVWRTWWLGDFCGALIVLPLALAWSAGLRDWGSRCWLELAAVLTAVAVLSEFALHSSATQAYIVFPALICAALRLGRRGATLAIAVAAGFAIWETSRQLGPLALGDSGASGLAAQLYLVVCALSTLCVAAVVTERREFARRLAASRARIVEAGRASAGGSSATCTTARSSGWSRSRSASSSPPSRPAARPRARSPGCGPRASR